MQALVVKDDGNAETAVFREKPLGGVG